MRKTVLMVTPLLLLACVALGAMPGLAQNNVSDVLTVYRPDGSIIYQLGQFDAGEDGRTPVFINVTGIVDTSQFGNATTLCEALPCSANSPLSNFSDVFGVVNISGTLFLGFESDCDGLGCGAIDASQGAIFQLETPNVPVDATMYLDPSLRNSGYTATFVSDGDVPEPSSMLLLGSGLVGAFCFVRRRLI